MTAEGAWQVPPGSQDQGLDWKEGWPTACLVAGGSQPYRRPGPDKETGKPLIVLGLSLVRCRGHLVQSQSSGNLDAPPAFSAFPAIHPSTH